MASVVPSHTGLSVRGSVTRLSAAELKLLDGFEQAKSGNLGNLNTTDFEQFQDHWARFDTEAKGFIKTTDLKEFLRTLFEPWGFGGAAVDNVQLKLRIAALRLTIRHKDIDGAHHVSCVAFLEVLTHMTRLVLDYQDEEAAKRMYQQLASGGGRMPCYGK